MTDVAPKLEAITPPDLSQTDPKLAKVLDAVNMGGNGTKEPGKKPPSRAKRRGSAAAHNVGVKNLEKRMVELFGMIGLGFAAMNDEHCSGVILANAEAMASSINRLAEESDSVARVLNTTLEGSAWVGVALTVGPTAWQIVQHHTKTKEPLAEASAGVSSEQAPDLTEFEKRAMANAATTEVDNPATGAAVTLAWPTRTSEE